MCVHVCGPVHSEFTPPCTVEGSDGGHVCTSLFITVDPHMFVSVCVCVSVASPVDDVCTRSYFLNDTPTYQLHGSHVGKGHMKQGWFIDRDILIYLASFLVQYPSFGIREDSDGFISSIEDREYCDITQPARVIHCNIDSYHERKCFKMSVSQEASVLFWE